MVVALSPAGSGGSASDFKASFTQQHEPRHVLEHLQVWRPAGNRTPDVAPLDPETALADADAVQTTGGQNDRHDRRDQAAVGPASSGVARGPSHGCPCQEEKRRQTGLTGPGLEIEAQMVTERQVCVNGQVAPPVKRA